MKAGWVPSLKMAISTISSKLLIPNGIVSKAPVRSNGEKMRGERGCPASGAGSCTKGKSLSVAVAIAVFGCGPVGPTLGVGVAVGVGVGVAVQLGWTMK